MHGNVKDLSGMKFGRLTVIGRAPSSKYGHARWDCLCECGSRKTILSSSLISGKSTSCGCFQRERSTKTSHRIDLTGKRFNRLIVVEQEGLTPRGDAIWKCLCDCGNYTTATKARLEKGETKSCGCLRKEPKKHGMTVDGNSRIYRIWSGMKQRCQNQNRPRYPRYGGRGISVCPEWENFEPFYEWAMATGYGPEMTIDRIDNDGDYTPDNCRWITAAENTKKRWADKKKALAAERR